MDGKNELGSIGVLREPLAERLAGTADLDYQRGLAKELALDERVHDVLGVVRHGWMDELMMMIHKGRLESTKILIESFIP
jgi:sporulation-control protein spo0M